RRVTMGTAAQPGVDPRGFPCLLHHAAAATAMCFDQLREKQNREAPLSCDPRVEANPRSFVRRATAPREAAHLEENAREQSALSKKDKLTSRSIAGRDQTNARAEYIRTIPKHESGMTNERSKYAYGELGREHRFLFGFRHSFCNRHLSL